METINLGGLTLEQKSELKLQLAAEEAAFKAQIAAEKEAYKECAEGLASTLFDDLQVLSEQIKRVKGRVFTEAQSVIGLKEQVFGVKNEQRSHTFTDKAGRSICLGYRVNDGYDDTMGAGVTKVREYIKNLINSDETAVLVDTILNLLHTDKDGNLKPSRVLELEKACQNMGNPTDLREGIEIIKASYRPKRTCQFVEAWYKDQNGAKISVPLSMSAL